MSVTRLVDAYTQDGYVIVPRVFAHDDIDRMRDVIERYARRAGPLLRPRPTKNSGRIGVHHMVDFARDSELHPIFKRIHGSERLHSALASLFGGADLYRHFARTEISINRHLPWHRDIISPSPQSALHTYMQGCGPWDLAADGSGQCALFAAVYLQDHHESNSSLTVVPGTHRGPGGVAFPFNKAPTGASPEHTLHPRKGDAVLFDFRLLHRGQRSVAGELAVSDSDARLLVGLAYGCQNLYTTMWERAIRLRNELEVNMSMCRGNPSDHVCAARYVHDDLRRNPMPAQAVLRTPLALNRSEQQPQQRSRWGTSKTQGAKSASIDPPVDSVPAQAPATGQRRRRVVFIVGASRGIGLGLAKHYAEEGWQVHATTRNLTQPGALGLLNRHQVTLHELDVMSDQHRDNLVRQLSSPLVPIDLLIHNAAIQTTNVTLAMAVNAEAPFTLTNSLLPFVQRSHMRTICLITSADAGSRARERRTKGNLSAYGKSKLTLNIRFRADEPVWRAQGLTAVLVHPGWVRTDMGGERAQISVETSVRGIATVLQKVSYKESGACLRYDGTKCDPWK